MIMIYDWNKKLKRTLHVLEAEIIAVKKHLFDVCRSKDAFLQGVFQMTAIALVSVINDYDINELHLFWNIRYILSSWT